MLGNQPPWTLGSAPRSGFNLNLSGEVNAAQKLEGANFAELTASPLGRPALHTTQAFPWAPTAASHA